MKQLTIPQQKSKEIDWSKPQWVISNDKDIVVCTTGAFEMMDKSFIGFAVPCNAYPVGEYDTVWDMRDFTRLDFDIPFVISND